MNVVLETNEKDPTKLNLSERPRFGSIEDLSSVAKTVYRDSFYKLRLTDFPEGTRILNVRIEDAEYTGYTSESEGSFYPLENGTDAKLFSDALGAVTVELSIRTAGGIEKKYYSEYASILVPEDEDLSDVRDMLSVIDEFQGDFLYETAEALEISKNAGNRDDSLSMRVNLLQEIASIYERCFGFFKINSRYKLDQILEVDRADKLQYVGSDTISYMMQHPEYLREDVKGVEFDGRHYIPEKALILKKHITFDIYENRLVLGFLRKLLHDAEALKDGLSSIESKLKEEREESNGYQNTAVFLVRGIRSEIQKYIRTVDVSEERLRKLYILYRRILPVEEISMEIRPHPTPILMSVPQYNMIYLEMVKWYGLTGYEFMREDELLHLFNVPKVYELYVLVKLLDMIQKNRYILENSIRRDYGLHDNAFYENRLVNNTFVFTRSSGEKLTLFYTPVIYDNTKLPDSMISLIRGTSVSLSKNDWDNSTGHFYVPDYVVKIEKEEKEHYYILDAKYKTYDTVRFRDVAKLSFKYLISLLPTKPDASLDGLVLIYGRTKDNDVMKDFYDTKSIGPDMAKPGIWLFPMSERITENGGLDEFLGEKLPESAKLAENPIYI